MKENRRRRGTARSPAYNRGSGLRQVVRVTTSSRTHPGLNRQDYPFLGQFFRPIRRKDLKEKRRDLIVRIPTGTPPVADIPPGHISYVTDQMNRIKPMPARLLNPAGASRGYIPDGHRRNWDLSLTWTTQA
ncbi:hypothetical protein Bbelb_384570 [Branchiostoma belcheri]|nr:hypothetical protein Bbelb_384570 [Branchiostoma belcheri]